MPARFVIDNSIVMSWCFEDEGNRYAEAVLESLESAEAIAPAIWPLEVGNVLLVAERKKRLSQAAVVRFLALLGGLPITVEQETPERMLKEIVSLARAHGLSTYDASYLDLAMRVDLPLATRDTSLAKAAKKCKVPTFEPARAW
ncbi:type II toxin-antitoxin system VapC family toxin [Syntrophobacter fumaroxidans]|jgi:predicted nucleic acid-binding protein|uniref:Ribonuclease VapC n=1 Tax=Syntrophobacter fumaroxidans (strain DSM 10017 / MPOB) TaxID=335543 RepID=A0LI46_SYNFM|nr:type II toxin-antitoxin system VapC family toxin [Syntrophobacter fumaroxidans]ABK17098.1 PilT protein domain protein [Syntrophobacter fumaroxidans MPOB]